MVVSDRQQYADFTVSGSGVSSTVISSGILTPLLALFAAAPQTTTAVNNNGAVQYVSAVTISHLDIHWKFIGSESTTLVAADLWNTIRGVLLYTEEDTGSAAPAALVSTDASLNTQDVKEILSDDTTVLTCQAFESTSGTSGNSVPGIRSLRFNVPLNKRFDFYTLTAGGTGGWVSKKGNLVYNVVSDSSVVPNPTYWLTVRMWYKAAFRR